MHNFALGIPLFALGLFAAINAKLLSHYDYAANGLVGPSPLLALSSPSQLAGLVLPGTAGSYGGAGAFGLAAAGTIPFAATSFDLAGDRDLGAACALAFP